MLAHFRIVDGCIWEQARVVAALECSHADFLMKLQWSCEVRVYGRAEVVLGARRFFNRRRARESRFKGAFDG